MRRMRRMTGKVIISPKGHILGEDVKDMVKTGIWMVAGTSLSWFASNAGGTLSLRQLGGTIAGALAGIFLSKIAHTTTYGENPNDPPS